jgi:hypothetical protein
MRPGLAAHRNHNYKRHGMTALFAALDIATGRVIGKCYGRHRATEHLRCTGVSSAKILRIAGFKFGVLLDRVRWRGPARGSTFHGTRPAARTCVERSAQLGHEFRFINCRIVPSHLPRHNPPAALAMLGLVHPILQFVAFA